MTINAGGIFIGTTTNGGIGGTKTEPGIGSNDIWITKLNHNGQIITDKTIGTIKADVVSAIERFNDDFMVVTSYTKASQEGDLIFTSYGIEDIWVLMLDNNLNIIAQGLYGGVNYEAGSTNILCQNDKITFATLSTSGVSGVKNEPGRGNYDSWILQLQYNSTGLSEVVKENPYIIYPNPSNGLLNVSGCEAGSKYKLTNIEGKLL